MLGRYSVPGAEITSTFAVISKKLIKEFYLLVYSATVPYNPVKANRASGKHISSMPISQARNHVAACFILLYCLV
jgi:hypothetical protein